MMINDRSDVKGQSARGALLEGPTPAPLASDCAWGLSLFSRFCIIMAIAWLILCVYGWGSWIISPSYFKPLPHGPDEFNTGRLFLMRVLEIAGLIVFISMFYALLIRPWRKGKGLTTEGAIFLGFSLGFFWDPTINYFHWAFAWNTHMLNMGDWLPFIPGHRFNHRVADGVAWALPQYSYLTLLQAVLMVRGIRAMRARCIGMLPAFFAVCAACFVADIIWEMTVILLEFYAYPRGFSWFTLFPGQWYQFPLNEAVSVALLSVGPALLLLAVKEGRPHFLERGLASVSSRLRPAAVFIAVVGFCAMTPGVTYFIPWMAISTVTDSNVPVWRYPSYMRYDAAIESPGPVQPLKKEGIEG